MKPATVSSNGNPREPLLSGVKVSGLGHELQGPACAQYLADPGLGYEQLRARRAGLELLAASSVVKLGPVQTSVPLPIPLSRVMSGAT